MSAYTSGQKVIKPKSLGKEIAAILKRFKKESLSYADKITHDVGVNLFGQIIEDTPIGDFDPDHVGTLKGNWVVSTGNPSASLPNKRSPRRTRKGIKSKVSKKIASGKKKAFLTNNSEYAGVVEYGGYPFPVKLGTWNKRLGRYEIRSDKKFSKQAPAGMMRINTRRFKSYLNEAKARF